MHFVTKKGFGQADFKIFTGISLNKRIKAF